MPQARWRLHLVNLARDNPAISPCCSFSIILFPFAILHQHTNSSKDAGAEAATAGGGGRRREYLN